PAAGEAQRALAAVVLPEDLHRLRKAEDATGQRDLLAFEAGGAPAAVPVLVEVADRQGGRLVEPDHARDVGAALAAQLVHRLRAARALHDDVLELLGAL